MGHSKMRLKQSTACRSLPFLCTDILEISNLFKAISGLACRVAGNAVVAKLTNKLPWEFPVLFCCCYFLLGWDLQSLAHVSNKHLAYIYSLLEAFAVWGFWSNCSSGRIFVLFAGEVLNCGPESGPCSRNDIYIKEMLRWVIKSNLPVSK